MGHGNVIDIDSWIQDIAPIEVRLGGRRWLLRAPSFEDAAGVAEASEHWSRAWQQGEISVQDYVRQMTDALLSRARFHGIPDRLGRWAVRWLLGRYPVPYRLRAVEMLASRFADSLRQQWAAAGGNAVAAPPPRATGSPPPSRSSVIGTPDSFGETSPGAVSGVSSPPPSASRLPN